MSRSLLTLTMFVALSAVPVLAQGSTESATDATTTMDKQLGNLDAPKDDTLSNQEVVKLQNQENSTGQEQTTGPTITTGQAAPAVSGTTAIYKEKTGSAAKSEGDTE